MPFAAVAVGNAELAFYSLSWLAGLRIVGGRAVDAPRAVQAGLALSAALVADSVRGVLVEAEWAFRAAGALVEEEGLVTC